MKCAQKCDSNSRASCAKHIEPLDLVDIWFEFAHKSADADKRIDRTSLRLDPLRPARAATHTGRQHSPIHGFLRQHRSRSWDPIDRRHYHPPQFVERLRRWRPLPLLWRSHWLLQSVRAVRHHRPRHGRLSAVHVVAGRWRQFAWRRRWRQRRPPDTDQFVARHIGPERVFGRWRRRFAAGQGRAHDAAVRAGRRQWGRLDGQPVGRRWQFEHSDGVIARPDAAEHDARIAGEQLAEWRIAGRFEDAVGCEAAIDRVRGVRRQELGQALRAVYVWRWVFIFGSGN